MCIPISNRFPEDSFIRAWTIKGKFTVKSAYRMVQKWLKEGSNRFETGSISNNSKMKAIWKMIWKLNCPNKFKHFMWRACKNILPTKNCLKASGVGLEDCCALCGLSETSGHILWGYKFAKTVWSATKIKLLCCLIH